MREILTEYLADWVKSLVDKLLENPIINLIYFIVSIILIYAFSVVFYNTYGIITMISYIFACFYGLTRIIDDPRRPIYWAVGFIFGAVAFDLFTQHFISTIRSGDIVSLYSGLVVLFVIVLFYLKSKEFKSL